MDRGRGNATVINFTKDERSRKSFSYYRDHQTESWKNLDNVDKDDYYFSRFMTRIRKAILHRKYREFRKITQ